MLNKLKYIFLIVLGFPKTILFNFHYFPLKEAIHLPVLISHRTWLKKLRGEVKLEQFYFGMVKIGFGDVGVFDQKRSRSIWEVTGLVLFKGMARIGHGSKISVSGSLELGEHFFISAESSIIAMNSISFGYNVLISWDVLVMDHDIHQIYDASERPCAVTKPIVIGNNVWIGSRSLILKGVTLADGIVVAAYANVVKPFNQKKIIIGGNPAKKLKENIRWEM